MREPPRSWPDGRPVGGENGYPPEYAEWTLFCQALMVARLMLEVPRGQRESVFKQWEGRVPGVTRERVREALRQHKATTGNE